MRELAARIATLAQLDLFVPLTDTERQALAADLADCPFVTHDVIARQGEPADSLFILARDTSPSSTTARGAPACGTAWRRSKRRVTSARWDSLTGQARGATVVAEDEVLCYRLEKAGFDAILHGRPELIEALSQVVAARQAANDAKLQTLSADARAKQAVGRTADLVQRMRRFFAIQ